MVFTTEICHRRNFLSAFPLEIKTVLFWLSRFFVSPYSGIAPPRTRGDNVWQLCERHIEVQLKVHVYGMPKVILDVNLLYNKWSMQAHKLWVDSMLSALSSQSTRVLRHQTEIKTIIAFHMRDELKFIIGMRIKNRPSQGLLHDRCFLRLRMFFCCVYVHS